MKSSRTLERHNSSNTRTETHLKSAGGTSGKARKSSGDAMSHKKAGTQQGAGGGKKQERQH